MKEVMYILKIETIESETTVRGLLHHLFKYIFVLLRQVVQVVIFQ